MFRPMRRMERRTEEVAIVGTAAVVGSHEAKEAELHQAAAAPPAEAQPAAEQSAPPPAEASAPAPAAPAPAGGSGITAQLEELSQLHTAGVLSDQEFEEAKQKVLTGG